MFMLSSPRTVLMEVGQCTMKVISYSVISQHGTACQHHLPVFFAKLTRVMKERSYVHLSTQQQQYFPEVPR